MRQATKEDLLAVTNKYPDLADVGFRSNSFYDRSKSADERRQDFNSNRSHLISEGLRPFQLCCEWLSNCQMRNTINKNFGSYGLKHYVERWATRKGIDDYYIPNGAFIAAAIHMGFKCEPIFDSPNAYFNISSRSAAIQEDRRSHN